LNQNGLSDLFDVLDVQDGKDIFVGGSLEGDLVSDVESLDASGSLTAEDAQDFALRCSGGFDQFVAKVGDHSVGVDEGLGLDGLKDFWRLLLHDDGQVQGLSGLEFVQKTLGDDLVSDH